MIRIKSAYEPASRRDGMRILVDRLWPRGVKKDDAKLNDWRPELAPSDELRRWFAHDPAKFVRFRARYRTELLRRRDAVAELALAAEKGIVTLVYGSKDPIHCNAAVLKELVDDALQ
jgi:uncharacterized protein YeaO (DUF488 family)